MLFYLEPKEKVRMFKESLIEIEGEAVIECQF